MFTLLEVLFEFPFVFRFSQSISARRVKRQGKESEVESEQRFHFSGSTVLLLSVGVQQICVENLEQRNKHRVGTTANMFGNT